MDLYYIYIWIIIGLKDVYKMDLYYINGLWFYRIYI